MTLLSEKLSSYEYKPYTKLFQEKEILISENIPNGCYFLSDENNSKIIMNWKSFTMLLFSIYQFNEALELLKNHYIKRLMIKADILFSQKFPHEV